MRILPSSRMVSARDTPRLEEAERMELSPAPTGVSQTGAGAKPLEDQEERSVQNENDIVGRRSVRVVRDAIRAARPDPVSGASHHGQESA
jgi:hypothetical protein